MKKQENQGINNQQLVIEDLTVNQDRAEEVKGGPELQTYLEIRLTNSMIS